MIYLIIALNFTFAQSNFTESKVIELLRTQSTLQMREEVLRSEVDLNQSLNAEKYQARAFTQYNFSRSSERPLIVFNPVLSPAEDWKAGVEKKLSYGLNVRGEVFGSQFSTQDESFKNVTQTGTRVSAEIDLWKNVFGRLDRAQLRSLKAQKKRAELQQSVGLKRQEVELRKAYWSLIALDQSMELSQELVKSADRQFQDALSRQKLGAADSAEVARSSSQVESRKSSLLLFEYERELLMQVFEKNFVSFKSSDWKAPTGVMNQTLPQIQQCINQIESQKELSLDATTLDEMISLLKSETEDELFQAQKHDSVDVSLVAQYQTSGVGSSYRNSRTALEDEDRSGYGLGLVVSVPLGSQKSNSERALLSLKRNSLQAQDIQYRWLANEFFSKIFS